MSSPSSLDEIPESSQKSFVFLHQRVNHTPYTSNCAPAPEGLYIFDADGGSTDDRRRAAYDNGLRCWDRDVSAMVEPFLKRPGAVHIFITADHSELMAETGSWGHGFTDLRVAMVPMMLLTNRPRSDVATLFSVVVAADHLPFGADGRASVGRAFGDARRRGQPVLSE